ncbi:MAG: right-handed parallel beta-helix repeat-containing protein [bacterium]
MSNNLPLLFLALSLLVFSAQAQQSVSFFVSPQGNDSWSGRLPQPNKNKTDGPFASLARARDAIRELKSKQGGKLKQRVNVYIRGGTYFLKETFVLTPDDSGTKEFPITYSAYKNEKPIISGGRIISGWRREKLMGKDVWVAEIPEVKEGKWFFRELWLGERRLRRARHPNKGYLQVEKPPTNTNWMQGEDFFYKEGDIKPDPSLKNAEVIVMALWAESHLPIANIDEANRRITFTKRIVFPPQPGDPYYIENSLSYLDSPGEWCLERETGRLYYLPQAREEPQKTLIIAPRLSQLVRLEGKPEEGRFVEYVVFKGLTFSHCEWWFPEGHDVGGFAQAAWGVPGAIYAEGARNCLIENCTIKHIGTYGVELSRGCKDNSIISCEISDMGAGGVKIGEVSIRRNENEQTGDNKVMNSHIFNGGRIFHSAVGVWVGQSYGNIISHNLIHDFYYTGLSIGWTWGYGESLARDNVIEGNEVHHIGKLSNGDGPILSDMGGIYTLGIQPGTVIRFNLFHDIAGLHYGGWGIYFDEGSTHILAEKNIVYNTTHGGFHQHYGKENIVRNNIFAFGRDAQIQRSRPEEHISFYFQHNIVYWKEGVLFAGNLSDFHFVFDSNLYWKEGGEISFAGLTFAQWQEKGMDKHSLIADPLFLNPQKFDFRLRDASPAFKIGFVPFQIPPLKGR